ncbi:protein AHNAK2 isoform X2 [Mesoplodon densirostris]|uniref:protein AHNAK2 isoform X2 n=1 Tax=Mesoplodon densirostris TaxID=48708 RepID=UPI0028DB6766|nr:protein AHNAK2 isoform X2 [Mesoplodon densirostris]
MCDCFHMVLPTWPGAPGSVSGRQLQAEEPDAETEEDHSVTEGSVDETIRPRPQGSSPVYEYVTEGASFGLPEDTPRRRRSWWKRDSGDSQTLSRMSRLEEATGETLKTKVEAGASGYIVTGGGDQGIFVKQVLKESSAAKLFSLREGDQLLSTTIFFDDIKYEDALKILQYSEPYKVQFTIKRKLPAGEDEEGASGGARHGSRGSKKQDQDIADGRSETPTKTLQEDGDQERLISKPRQGRGRQPQRERLSWPKFQALKSKRGPGPRRSHSSSEAYERGDMPDLSPTSTDTEAQVPEEEQVPEAGPGRQQKRSFPNLRFRVGSRKGLSGRGAHGGTVQAGVLVETGPWDSGREAARAAAHGGREDRTAGVPEDAEPPAEPGLPIEGAPGEGAGPAPRLRRKTKEARDKGETVPQGKAGVGPAPRQSREGATEGTQTLEIGIARLSLQDSADQGSHQNHQPEFHVRIPTLKTPRFGLYKEKVLEKEGATTALQGGPRQRRDSGEDTEAKKEDAGGAEMHRSRQAPGHLPAQEGGEPEEGAARQRGEDSQAGDQHMDEKEGKMKTLKFKLPSFGWSPAKEAKGDKVTQLQEAEKEKESSITVVTLETDRKGKDALETDSKFKMPKFKMPSFGGSAPRKSVEAAVEVSVPKAQAEVTLPSVQADGKTSDFSIELPSTELEVKAAEVNVKLPEGHLPEIEPKETVGGIGLKSHLPKVTGPSIKVPEVDIKAPQVDIKVPKLDLKDAKVKVMTPDLEVSLPSVEVDSQVAGSKLEGDVALGDKEVTSRDSKFKMPKFKMPSFGVSAPSKSVKATVEVSVPKAQAEVTLPSVQADVKTSDLSIELPSAELEVKATEVGLKLPEGHIAEAKPKEVAAGVGLKGHVPKVQMPSIKVPKVDIKGPKLDLKDAKGEVTAPDVEVSLPSMELDTQSVGSKLEGDVSLGDKEVAARDSKFKMPKFKMPSFGGSAPSKSVEAAVEVSMPKAQAEVTLPSLQADVKISDLSIELPSTELEVKAAEVGMKLPKGHLPEIEPKEAVGEIGLKGHLPKVTGPSIKVPEVDIKAPQVDIKGPKLDLQCTKGEVMTPDMEVSLPSVEVDTQAVGSKLEGDVALGDKEVAARDSKFKMPKFKIPSFGVSAPSKSVKATVEVSVPKTQAMVTLPSVQADVKTSDLSIELPSAELEVKATEVGLKLPEGHTAEAEPKEVAAGIGLKGHVPKVQMPSIKVPKVDIKGPKLDLKDAKGEVMVPDVEVSLPSVEVDTQSVGSKLEGDMSLGDKEVAARDSKFKMSKFKMPSFGGSAPSKSVEAAVEVSLPKAQAEVTLPSLQADVKTSDLSIELPSAELEVKAAEVGMKLPEGHLPEIEPKETVGGIGLKGHLPKVTRPSIKVPEVDIKAPQVDIKVPKLDLKDAKVKMTASDVEVSLPSVEVDTQVVCSKLEGDIALRDKEVTARDSKFKMPKFKMPSFGVSAPSKSIKATVEVSVPKTQTEVTSVQAHGKTSDFSIELPSTELEVKATEVGLKLPEGHIAEAEPKEVAAGIGLKGHVPKVQMPSIKVPKVDIKGPKLDLKDAKGEVTARDVELSLPSVVVDTEAAGIMLAGDVSLGDKEVAVRDSKFKMPKFKMPSIGVSAPSKSIKATMEVSMHKAQAKVNLPSVQADGKTSDLNIELPSPELEVKVTEVGVKLLEGHLPKGEPKQVAAGIGLKGHLPKVQMPSIKVPKVDIKGPKLDLKDAKGEVTVPDVEVSLPSVEVDTQSVGSKLEGDVSLGDKEVAARDSKFKMPKFKMPSFGGSAPSKSIETTVEVSVPKAQAEVTLPSLQADIKISDLSIELPSAKLEVKPAEVGMKLPEGHLPEVEPKEAVAEFGLKGHLPKVTGPSIKVPEVDIKALQVDIKGPKLDLQDAKGEVTTPDMEVSLPSVEVDTQAAGSKLEGDGSLGDKKVAVTDSKFKMPKFKMPSFGGSAPSKSVKATVEVSVPKAQAEVTLPSDQADVKTSDLSIELPSAELEVKAAEVGVKLPEGHLPEIEPKEAVGGIGLKGHLPKVTGPSIKVPGADFKAPQVDIKVPKLDLKDAKVKVTTSDMEVSLPSVEVDTQVAGSKLEGDVALGDKEVTARDSKFKMPKFKMPSFEVSAPSKSVEAALDESIAMAQAQVTLPLVQADMKISDISIELPSAELEVKGAEVGVKLPEGHLPRAEPKEVAAGIGLKGHLPKVQKPSIKVPKVDIKAPQVDIKGPKLDLQDAKGEVRAPNVEVSLPSVEVDTQAAGIMLAGDVSLGDKEVTIRDSKFKMPKFKMPSIGVSAPSKSVKATVEVSVPKAQAEVTLPSVQADVKTCDLNIELPSAELEVKAAKVGMKLPEGHLPEVEPKEAVAEFELKGHLPKVTGPSIKVPEVDIKAPQVDIKGPKLDLQDAKGEVTIPDMEVSLPRVEVDTQAAGSKLEGDGSLGDKKVAVTDSKFKMPKFKMPSLGVSAPSKSVKPTVEVSLPKAQAEVTLPSDQADVKTSDLSIELPSAELEVKAAEVGVKLPEGPLPEIEPKETVGGIGLKGHLPKVTGPSIKVPGADFKAPQVDIKVPKLDLKDAKVKVTASDMEVSLPSVEVDTQVAGSKLEGDVALGDKEVTARDSKFKVPKFKMPSFEVSAPSKSVEAALDGSIAMAPAEVTLPSVQADVKTSDVSVELPSAKLEVKGAEVGVKLPEGHLPRAEPKEVAAGIGLKGHLPKVQKPSIKVPKVDIKAPQVDIKGPKLDLKDAKGEVTAPDVEVSLPNVEVDTQAAGSKLEGDVSLGDKEVAARDGKFKMPKFKMPSFGVSVPSKSIEASLEGSMPKAQAEVTLPLVQADSMTSDLSIKLPSTELEVKAAEVGMKLPEGRIVEAEPKEAAAGIGLKGHLSRVHMPGIKVPEVHIKAPQVDIKGPNLDLKDTKGEVTAPDVEVSIPSVEVDNQAVGGKLVGDVPLGDEEVAARVRNIEMEGGGNIQIKKSHFKIPEVFSSSGKSFKSSAPVDVYFGVSLPPSTSVTFSEFSGGESSTQDLATREPSMPLPWLGWPGLSGSLDLSGIHAEPASLSPAEGIILTKYQVTLPRAAAPTELPLEAAPCSQNNTYLPSMGSSASLPTQVRVAVSQTDSPAGLVDPMFLASYGRVSFPKFHPPKFGFSVPEAADAEVEAGAGDCAPSLSTTGPARGLDSTAVPRSTGLSAVAAGETPAKDTERGGKDSPLKMPWIKLPSFRWSPKKGAVPPGDPECSLDDAELGMAVDTGHKGVPPGCPVSAVDVAVDVPPEKDREEKGMKSPGCAVLEHAPLTVLTPEGGPGLPRGDPAAPRSRSPAGGGARATERASREVGAGGTGTVVSPPEGAGVDPHLPQAHAPLLDFARPDLRPSKAKVGVSSSAGDPPSLAHSSQGHGLQDGSASQPLGEATAPSVGDSQQPSCSPADVDAPAVESAASQGGWFRMPALRLPSLRRPAKERGVAGAQGAPVPAPAASALREGERPAPVGAQGVPGSEVEEAMSLQSPEAGADEASVELVSDADADVLKRNLEDKGSEPHLSPAGVPAADLPPSEAGVRPGEGSLPLQMPSGRLSGTQAPPAGPAGLGLAARQGRAEEWSSQPEGPIKLKASRTDGPSQVSVINMGQPWEGSVVTVRLPRLSVPRFAFPDPSSEADVFIPAVTEVRCPGSSLAHALHEESPGVWGASILKAGAETPGEQPVALDFSPEASPVSKVRVHIQRAQGESPEVAVHSRVTAELADLSGTEAISTQVVRQLEIPASEIQTASYGFSLLKVKVPEPRTRVSVRDSRLREGLQEAPEQAAPGAEPASGGLQPDTGEPFDVISSSVHVPGRPTFTPKVHSGHQGADSCSDDDDDEAAEVLEFPPEEGSGEAATSRAEEDRAPKEKPGSKRSGLFRFWLPNIGFSSSAEEPRADSKDEARASAAVQTQAGARPEAELPQKPQQAGWCRFPALGLSSPTEKSESAEDDAAPAEQTPHEQAATFFDAPESSSPEGGGAGSRRDGRRRSCDHVRSKDGAGAAGAGPRGRDEPASGPTTK